MVLAKPWIGSSKPRIELGLIYARSPNHTQKTKKSENKDDMNSLEYIDSIDYFEDFKRIDSVEIVN